MPPFASRLTPLLGGVAAAALLAFPAVALPPSGTATTSGSVGFDTSQAGQLGVTPQTARTIIDWQSYNIANGEAVRYFMEGRHWIVLNRVANSQISINGVLQSMVGSQFGGNVWFTSPQGVVFGPNARVDVGGLLASSASVDEFEFLDAGNLSFDFTSLPTAGGVTVQGGAQLRGYGGTLALVSGQVNTLAGSSLSGAEDTSIFYGAASGFTVNFLEQSGSDLDMVDFFVPSGGGTASITPLRLDGATTAGDVYVAAVNRADVLNAVINAPGLIVAQSASSDGGTVVLSSGQDLSGGFTSPSGGGRPVATADFGQVVASGEMRIAFESPFVGVSDFFADSLAAGGTIDAASRGFTIQTATGQTLTAGSDIFITARGDVSLQNVGAGGDIVIASTPPSEEDFGAGQVTANSITAAGDIVIDGRGLTVGSLSSGARIAVRGLRTEAGLASTGVGVAIRALADDDLSLYSDGGSVVVPNVTISGSGPDVDGDGRIIGLRTDGGGDVLLGLGTGQLIAPTGYIAIISADRDAIVNLTSGATFDTTTGGRDVRITTAGPLVLGEVAGTRDLLVQAPTLNVAALSFLSSFTRDITLAATAGSINYLQPLSAGRNLSVSGLTGVTLGSATAQTGSLSVVGGSGAVVGGAFSAAQDATVLAGANVTVTSINAGGALSAISTGGAVTGTTYGSVQNATVDGRTGVTVTTISSSAGAVSVGSAAGAITGTSYTGATGVGISSSGAIAVTTATASSGALSVNSASGAVTGGAYSGASSATVVGGAQVQLASLSSSNGLVQVTSNGSVTVGTATAATSIGAVGVTGVALPIANAGTVLNVASGSGAVTGTTFTGPQGVSVTGQTAVNVANISSSAGATQVTSAAGNIIGIAFNGQTGLTVTGQTGVSVPTLTAPNGPLNLFSAAGTVNVTTASSGGAARVGAADFNLLTSLTAPSLQVESNGALILGGPSGAAPAANTLRIDNAEFQRILVTDQASFYAGSTSGPARGDLTVLDLSVVPTRVPRLNLYAGANNSVLVQGVLAPSVTGGALRIGDTGAWRPGQIIVTGSIGAASGDPEAGFTGVRAFNSVTLNATRDILIGSQRFVDLVRPVAAADIDIARGRPAGVDPITGEIGRVFIAAGTLSLAASDRIVQQNTGLPGRQNGIYLANLSPLQASVLSLAPPPLVDLFGSFVNSAGVLTTGLNAALAPDISLPNEFGFSPSVRFNGCAIGSAAGCLTVAGPSTEFRLEDFDLVSPEEAVDEGEVSEGAAEEDDENQVDPVITGAGNEEIWRRRK